MFRFIQFIVLMFLIVGCSNEELDDNADIVSKSVNGQISIIAEDLIIPWSIEKDGDSIFLTQREGKLSEVNAIDGQVLPQNLIVNKDIHHVGEGGLLGFVLSPKFATTKEAYMYYTYQQDGKILNRIILVKREGDKWSEVESLIEGIPGGRIHNGGRLKIGPDQKLYITTGDGGFPENAQNIESLAGKILRSNLDGSIPLDNPYSNSYVYSYGHRNPQGLTWDEAGNLYSTEHGQSAHDEINLIKPGKNYGWPVIEGDQTAPNMETPMYHTGNETWAPSGIAFYEGKLVIATLRGQKIKTYHIETGEIGTLFDQNSRMRDVFIEKDTLYTITNNRDGRGTPQQGDDKLILIKLNNIQ